MTIMDVKNKEILPKNWVKRVSRSREGRTYFWNTKTKKSVWHLKEVFAEEKLVTEKPKDGTQRPMKKNIASDRMKKLQENLNKNGKILAKSQVKAGSSKTTESPSKKRKVEPSPSAISSSSSAKVSSEPKSVPRPKRPLEAFADKLQKLKVKLPSEEHQPPHLTVCATMKQRLDPCQRVSEKNFLSKPESCREKSLTIPVKRERASVLFSSQLNSSITIPVERIDIPVDTLSTEKQLSEETVLATKRQRLDPRQRVLNPKVQIPSSCQKQQLVIPTTDEHSTIPHTSTLNPSLLSPINPIVDIPEPMDWNEIPEELILREIASIRNTDDIDVEMKPIEESNAEDNLNVDAFETMEQYLNYKSLILADNFDPKQFFIVIDTNVFISNLEFIVSLPRTTFKAGCPTIVIPYIVLQELDKLKSVSDPRLAIQAKTAISMLNQKFQAKDPGFVGQSTMDNAKELIQIENADDRILNCALQRQNMSNVILLSNDNNLRNKAFVNSVDAFSAKELERTIYTFDFL